jgi:hypothetical protein
MYPLIYAALSVSLGHACGDQIRMIWRRPVLAT